MRVKSLWRSQTGIFFGLLFLLLWLGQSKFLSDPGVFWSTRVGEQVLSDGAIPRHDTFSCTRSGQPWISQMWLGQCVMAALHAVGGLDALVLAAAAVLATLYTWVASRLIRTGWHPAAAVILVGLTVWASRYHLHARPHIATIVGMGLTIALLIDFEAGRISLRGLLWLWPLFALWINLHTGILGGLGTVGLCAVGWCAAGIVGANSPIRSVRDGVALFGVCVGCGLCLLVNPYGAKLIGNVLAVMGSPVVHQYIYEHMPLDWSNPYQRAVPIFALVYLLAIMNLRSWRSIQVTWLMPCVWFALTLDRVRQCTLFAITTALVLIEILPLTRLAAWLSQQDSWLYHPKQPPDRPGWNAWLLPGAAIVASLLLQATGATVPLLGAGWARLDPVLCPMALYQPLEEYGTQHPGAAVFNDMAYGGFLIYYTPRLRPFIDDRCELYGDAFLADYFHTNDALLKAREEHLAPAEVAQLGFIDRWEKQFGITMNIALVMKESGFQYYFEMMPNDWSKLGETDEKYGTALYRRRTSPSRPKPAGAESR
jgi:hypothetical protein